MTDWEIVVGLEVHVQLKTATKLFSPAPVRFGQPANVDVDAVDTGLPGALPVLNQQAVDLALKVGLACGSTIRRDSVFARKHYFYPDLPKGYQISQHDKPILEGGCVAVVVDDATGREKLIPLTRAHLEEDAGKSMHGDDGTRLDWNRAGTPLLEVVTAPALSSADEAMRCFRALRALVMALDVCDGNLQEGSMRADANVSVRRPGAPLGTRVEMKNINSPRFLHDAVVDEARRQIALLARGERVIQETRLWDADKGASRSMRSKEDAPDYRYLPDPDLPVVVVDDARVDAARASLPELPAQKKRRYVDGFGLAARAAAVVVDDAATAAFFDAAAALAPGHEQSLANWLLNEVLGLDDGLARVTPVQLARLVVLVDDGAVAGKSGKEVVRALGRDDDVDAVVDARGLRLQQGGDVDDAVRAVVRDVFAKNPAQVAQVKGGKDKVKGFLVGQALKALKGAADPKRVQRIVDEELAR
jgi:aspartyl-tRNA(Asn)/glutamyl-tRNA(Gln) amidotransferase subunit B